MGNLIRMDLYRMNKARSFRVCLILGFILSLASTPIGVLLTSLVKAMSTEPVPDIPTTADLCGMLSSPASSLVYMLCLLSIVSFFYADMENGYIKNIAGQMPRKGFSILSRFIAAIPHNLIFMLFALAGSILGTIPFQKIVMEGSLMRSIIYFFLKLALLQSLTAILLLVASSFRNKSLGMILAVLLGLPMMSLVYLAINTGLKQVFKGFEGINPYMPDTVLKEDAPGMLRAFLVSVVTIGIFLPLSIRVFDKRDVK